MSALKMCAVDCECPEDFYQYYRNRWFAIPDGDVTHPATCNNAEGGRIDITKIMSTEEEVRGPVEWRDLRKIAKFGLPTIGNVSFFDTYQYMWNFARRESIKGIAPDRLQAWFPDAYGLNVEHVKRVYGNPNTYNEKKYSTATRTLLWNIYNPKFWTFDEAVTALSDGTRIGCPLDGRTGLHLSKQCPHICVSSRWRTVGYLTDDRKVKLFSQFQYLADVLKLSFPEDVKIK
jgi:hypothetical protein